MDLDGLLALLDEIRDGRSEDASTELKESWWRFDASPKAKTEFIKDIAAMANANTGDERVIVVGVSSTGAVQDAPLPEDEAKLQQRLQAITPCPHVAFKPMLLPTGETLTVIEILPPFDKPYLIKLDDRNMIFVRQGSTTTTATRNMLDAWYKARKGKPNLILGLRDSNIADGEQFDLVHDFLLLADEEQFDLVHEIVKAGPSIASRRPSLAATIASYGRPASKRSSLSGRDPDFGATIAAYGSALRKAQRPSLQAQLDAENRIIGLSITLLNDSSSTPAEELTADFTFSGVEGIAEYKRVLIARLNTSAVPTLERPTHANDPLRNCHVEYARMERGKGRMRQRMRRVNPRVREEFCTTWLVLPEIAATDEPSIAMSFAVTDGSGERIEATITLHLRFAERVLTHAEATALADL